MDKLNETDRAAFQRATINGWLTLTSELSDTALAAWQRYCLLARRPFVVIRPEPSRATLWLALPPEREWSVRERDMVADTLIGASGVVLHSAGVRAFLKLNMEKTVATRLIALALAASMAEQATPSQDSAEPLN